MTDKRITFCYSGEDGFRGSLDWTLKDVHDYLISDYAALRTEVLRTMRKEDDARSYLMNEFDCVYFSGIFSRDGRCSMVRPSFYVCFTFQDIDVESCRHLLLGRSRFPTLLLFRTERGNGLNWVIRNDSGRSHQDFHHLVSRELFRSLRLSPLPSGASLFTPIFLPHDGDAYIYGGKTDNHSEEKKD